jgi:Rrf2 family protein
VRISARADYAVRACIELVRAGAQGCTSEAMSKAQDIPQPFLQNVLGDIRRAGYVRSSVRRGGGYRLAVPADEVSVADILRAIDSPLLQVHGVHPDELRYPESTAAVAGLWSAVCQGMTALLEQVSLRDVADGELPRLASLPAGIVDDGQSDALTA